MKESFKGFSFLSGCGTLAARAKLILSLARPVGHHDTPASVLRHCGRLLQAAGRHPQSLLLMSTTLLVIQASIASVIDPI